MDIDVQTSDPTEQLLAQRDRLQMFGQSLAKKRDEWVRARASIGVDRRMKDAADQYQGIDSVNRTSNSTMMESVFNGGPIYATQNRATRSTLFVNITRQKTNISEARLADIVLPTDDCNFSVENTGVADVPVSTLPNGLAVDPRTGQAAVDPRTGQPMAPSDVQKAINEMAAQKARNMQAEIEDQFTECDFNAEARKMIHNAAVFGTGVMKGPVVMSRTRKAWIKQTDAMGKATYVQEIVAQLSPASYSVDPRRVFPDPACGDFVQDGSGIFEYDLLTPKRVRDLRKQPGYLKDQLAQVLESPPPVTKAVHDVRDSDTRDMSQGEAYEKWEYTGEVDIDDLKAAGLVPPGSDTSPLKAYSAVVEMIGDVVVRVYMNPLEDGALPYDFFPWEKSPDSVWGYGVPYILKAQQQVTNAAWRQMMDNSGISSGPIVILKPGAVQPADKKWEITGRKIFFASSDVTDVRTVFTTVQVDSRQQELSNILQLSEKLSDIESGVPLVLQGNQGSAPETVGGMQMLMNGNNTMLRRLVKQYDDYIIKPHVRRYYDFNMAYSDKDDIKGDFCVNARGSSALLVKDIQNQTFIQLVGMAANPAFAPMIDLKKLFEKALRAQHVDPAEILKTDDQIKRDMEMAAQNQQPDPRVAAAKFRSEADRERTAAQMQETQMTLSAKMQMNREDMEAHMQGKLIEREIAMMQLARDQNVSLEKIKAQLADTAMRERNKREMFMAESQIKAATGTGI